MPLSPETQFGPGPIRQGVFRGQPVHFQVVDGWAVADGDMILGKAEDLEAALHNDRALPDKQVGPKSIFRASDAFLWPDMTIPYRLSPGFPEPERVTEAIQHWEDETDIEFVEYTDQADFITFFAVPGGCSSFVGRAGGEQFILLSTGCGRGTIIHEIGHAVGLYHENQRADSDEWISLFEENTDKRFFGGNFPPVGSRAVDSGAYDYGSIMHYGPFFFTNRAGATTVETIPPGMPIGQRQALSPGDIDGVIRLYEEQPERTVVTTNPAGLRITVDGETFTAPRSFNWIPGSMHEVSVETQVDGDTRYLFGRWSDDGEQTHMYEASLDTTVLTASFIEQYRILTEVTPANGGSIEITPVAADGFHTARSEVGISATPAQGFFFAGWFGFTFRGIHGDASNPAVFTNNSGGSIYNAFFVTDPPLILDTNVPATRVDVDGVLRSLPAAISFPPGTTVTIGPPPFIQTCRRQHALPASGLERRGAPTRDLVIPAEGDVITADFQVQHLLTTAASPPTRGSVFVSPNRFDGYYNEGDQVTIAGAPNDDSQFLLWFGI